MTFDPGTTTFERAAVAAEMALDNCIESPHGRGPIGDRIARAVLMAVREPDPQIKDKITIGGWIEDELKYDDAWTGTIDAILAEPQP